MAERRMVGTLASPKSFAAATRPWPAIMVSASSISTGLVKPDAIGDLLDLALGMRARIARVRLQAGNGPQFDLGCRQSKTSVVDMTDTLPMPAGNVIHINAGGITLKIRSP